MGKYLIQHRFFKVFTVLVVITFIFNGGVQAAESGQVINWLKLIFGLFGGLALFLYGMELMSEGMKKSAGNKMRSIMTALTKNRVIGLFSGAFVTMVIQSSSATTVMLVSFVQAGLMSFVQALGVILGADIGTTITAQMIAFKLTDYALIIIVIGFFLRMMGKTEDMKNIGEAIVGFGILFYGMKLMSDSMKPLRTYAVFINTLKELEHPFMGLLVGAGFTALIQSSSAFTGIVIVLAQQNLITLEAGIPLVFGANIGTCITAGLASIGTSREAKRVALAHVLFKIAGVLLFVFWIPGFAGIIKDIAEQFGSGEARQIANAHTIFNVSLAFVFLPFTGFFAKLIFKILPEEETADTQKLQTWHLDYNRISTPSLAINLARAEVARMCRILREMLDVVVTPFLESGSINDPKYPELGLIEGIDFRERKLDFIEEKIEEYLLKVSSQPLNKGEAAEVFRILSIINDMESIGDLVHRNVIPLITKKQNLSKDFSDEGKEEINIYHEKVIKQIHLLEEAFTEQNVKKAEQIMKKERKYMDLELQYRAKHLNQLFLEQSETLETHGIHMELMDVMKQVIVYTCNIATTFLSEGRHVYDKD